VKFEQLVATRQHRFYVDLCRVLFRCPCSNFARNVVSSSVSGSDYVPQISSKSLRSVFVQRKINADVFTGQTTGHAPNIMPLLQATPYCLLLQFTRPIRSSISALSVNEYELYGSEGKDGCGCFFVYGLVRGWVRGRCDQSDPVTSYVNSALTCLHLYTFNLYRQQADYTTSVGTFSTASDDGLRGIPSPGGLSSPVVSLSFCADLSPPTVPI